ncbi:MAG: histidine phosphatase family protein [Gemmatimonadetes bacterium]|nr:histidine phosphatase family protein [Gemmatimonadota bacterium]NIQ55178.1 histidine phosphatase family protein [Gemmatimonadota bacterium]NIU75376.1 histidine phosphatase family protein [Gammaproteobacteria bacterium]NIX45151.1 histidine phosphatase family protein [Gemmatimonadota bacterium]NIY09396.1 histidine phosphatase family protein [Gemmatimonadota bacterium]
MEPRTLYLLRHAKSSWDQPLEDRDRPLAPRGRRAARAMAEYMKREALVPDRVLCSPTTRTRQTWEIVAPILGTTLPVSYHDEIYEGGPGDVLDLVRREGNAEAALLVVGHNPGLELLAEHLAGRDTGEHLERLREKFPTAALAALELPAGPWSQVEYGAAKLIRFTRPKDLPEADERDL